jgi:L-alanine-DL-glutamate epimerase-like enolase superfamily enzyme
MDEMGEELVEIGVGSRPCRHRRQSEHPIRMAVLTEPIRHQAGWVEVPAGPGLGIEIDRAAMAKFLIG